MTDLEERADEARMRTKKSVNPRGFHIRPYVSFWEMLVASLAWKNSG